MAGVVVVVSGMEVDVAVAGPVGTEVPWGGVFSGSVGSGQVRSLHSSGQNYRILLWRYHCLLRVSPDGMIRSGSSV